MNTNCKFETLFAIIAKCLNELSRVSRTECLPSICNVCDIVMFVWLILKIWLWLRRPNSRLWLVQAYQYWTLIGQMAPALETPVTPQVCSALCHNCTRETHTGFDWDLNEEAERLKNTKCSVYPFMAWGWYFYQVIWLIKSNGGHLLHGLAQARLLLSWPRVSDVRPSGDVRPMLMETQFTQGAPSGHSLSVISPHICLCESEQWPIATVRPT